MHDEPTPNTKIIVMAAAGAAAVAGLLLILKRRDDEPDAPKERVEAVAADMQKQAKKAAKAAKKKRKEMTASAEQAGERLAEGLRESAASVGIDAKAAERDLKAAAWDAQQQAREAEHRLLATGQRVVGDAAHLATRFGSEARHLAGEGRERLAHLRHREEIAETAEEELARLREELESLRARLRGAGRGEEKEHLARFLRSRSKSGSTAQSVATEAAAAALSQVERTLRAKAPALLAAKNRGEVLEILQRELGPTFRETAAQAATAALAMWEASREKGEEEARQVRDRARHVASDARGHVDELAEAARHAADEARHATEEARAEAESHIHMPAGRGRFWPGRHNGASADGGERAAEPAPQQEEEPERHGKAGLFWGGAGLGLAIYALLDAERRDQLLRFANEASLQVQELVKDLQGYDDEF